MNNIVYIVGAVVIVLVDTFRARTSLRPTATPRMTGQQAAAHRLSPAFTPE